jgi:uncharacterized protein
MQTDSSSVSDGGRIAVVDILRAFALFGIIVTHAAGGFLAGRPPAPGFMTFGIVDQVFAKLDTLLVFGKFFTIFSFLFGLSFALQMQSAEAKGDSFAGRFAWRLAVLALIAFVHGLFFTGDILIIYALLGFLLIPMRKLGTKTLLVVAALLVFNVPGLVMGLIQANAPPPTPDQAQAMAEARALAMQVARENFLIKQTGGFAQLFATTYGSAFADKVMFQLFTGRLWITFGLFLLGLVAGRANLFRESEQTHAFFGKLLIGSAAIALLTTTLAVLHPPAYGPPTVANALAGFSFTAQQITLSAFYVALVTLLHWQDPEHGLLAKLAPAGKMGLTVYLSQTAFGLALFYGIGLGLLGKIGVAAAIGWGVAFYLVQLIAARAWMRHFTMGPVEWAWRALTWFKLPPLRRAASRGPVTSGELTPS